MCDCRGTFMEDGNQTPISCEGCRSWRTGVKRCDVDLGKDAKRATRNVVANVVALDFASVDWELIWQLAAEEGIQSGHRRGTASGYDCTCVFK